MSPLIADSVINSLRHRGPDAFGQYSDGPVWFGHVRLSILDLSDQAAQPMTSPDGRWVICYNGEVYNFRDLVSELRLSGLRSSSDTEVVLRAFAELGPSSLIRLNGIFAFAIYDRVRRRIWLARDRLGVKPLYYRLGEDGLSFASEIKAILALRGERPDCELASVHEWLYYGTSLGGRTLVRGISQLPPGHVLEFDLATGTSRIDTYWSIDEATRRLGPIRGSDADLVASTRELLELAVRRQLVSDVPVGVFLSGGVDSSAITAFAAKHYTGRLATYAAGFDDRDDVDERPKARRVAAHFGTEHHELHIGGNDVAALVEKMVHHHDGPFADAANIPLYLMAAQISASTKVVLQGDGGDEVFGGYRRYATLRYYPLLHPLGRLARGLFPRVPRSRAVQRVQRYVDAYAAPDLGTTMARLLTLEEARFDPTGVFTDGLRAEIARADPFARYRECQRRFADRDIANQMSMVDLSIELPDTFLEKVDRPTMAASLEVRVPFLDNDLIEHVMRIPGPRKMPWGRKKWLLKQALAGIVPHDVLYGPKTGFNVPFGYWLRTALRPFFFDHLARFRRVHPEVLRADVLESWFDDTISGRRDRSYMLWKVLNFMVWCNNAQVRVAR